MKISVTTIIIIAVVLVGVGWYVWTQTAIGKVAGLASKLPGKFSASAAAGAAQSLWEQGVIAWEALLG